MNTKMINRFNTNFISQGSFFPGTAVLAFTAIVLASQNSRGAEPLPASVDATPAETHSKRKPSSLLSRKASSASPSDTSDAEISLENVPVTASAKKDDNNPYSRRYNTDNATTATKTDTPVIETPVSIEIVPRAVVDDQQAIRLEEVARNVSGVQPGSSDGNYYDAFIVRGFDLGNNTYRNGFRIVANQSETANLERLEVLKGAAAMLYGRIEPGGLLNLVTKQPLETPYYSIQQQFGSYDLYRTTVDASGPLLADNALLYRFNLAYQQAHSFRDFIHGERIFIAPSMTWNATPDTQFNLNMEYRHENSVSDYGIPAVGTRPAKIPISRNLGEPASGFEGNVWLVEFTGTHAFNENWKLKGGVTANSTEYQWEDVSNRSGVLFPDAQGRADRILQRGLWFGPTNRDSQGVYLDLTGTFDLWGTRHSLLGGGNYYFWDVNNKIFTNHFSPYGCPIDIYNPQPYYGCTDFSKYRFLGRTAPDFNNIQEETWGGVYLQDQITFWDDKLHILAGGRYDWATTGAGYSPTSIKDIKVTNVDNHRFNPRVGVAYQPWSWLSVYGNYSESMGSANGTSATGQPFSPQTAIQYEGGIKVAWEGLTSTLAFYHLTKNNILGTDPNTGLSVPLGEARSRGIELDISGNLTDQLSLIATYAFTDARLTKSDNPLAEGKRLPYAPEQQGSFWTRYNITDNITVGTGVYIAGQREGDAVSSFQLPGYVRWDSMAAYRWEIGNTKLTAQINVNNILDKEYYKSGVSSNRLRIPVGEPLTVLGSLRLQF